jgi:hypothetical protein
MEAFESPNESLRLVAFRLLLGSEVMFDKLQSIHLVG